MAIITDTRNVTVVAAINTDLGQQIVIESYPGTKYLSEQFPGVRYRQEPYFKVTISYTGEGKDQHSLEVSSEMWLSSVEMRRLLEQVIKLEDK